MVTISIGSDVPRSVTARGSDAGNRLPDAVWRLERIWSPSASAAMRAASCTPLPEKFRPTCVAPEAWTPMRTFGAKPFVPAMVGELALDRDRARERVVGRVEPHEEPVAGRHDLLAAVIREQRPEGLVVPAQDALPRLVAEHLD